MLYFAYGSNLDWAQMKERCPSVRFVCTAKLKDYRLTFTRYSANPKRKGGVADVISETGHNVWGVVYQINERDIASLDACEGFQPGRTLKKNSYVREERHVYEDGDEKQPLLVSLYFAVPQEGGPFFPHHDYKKLIIDGANHWHLPRAYLAALEQIKVDG